MHTYKLMDSQKTREYEVTGAQKKVDAYKLLDSQKARECEVDHWCTESMCTDQESGKSVCEKQFMCRSAKE